jgi:CRISPR-associated exonuclease Cas4
MSQTKGDTVHCAGRTQADRVPVVAFGTVRAVPAGAIFHVKSKRRRDIALTPELRGRTEAAARRLLELVASGVTPPPVLKPRCRGCSLHDRCMPELLSRPDAVRRYHRSLFVLSSPG